MRFLRTGTPRGAFPEIVEFLEPGARGSRGPSLVSATARGSEGTGLAQKQPRAAWTGWPPSGHVDMTNDHSSATSRLPCCPLGCGRPRRGEEGRDRPGAVGFSRPVSWPSRKPLCVSRLCVPLLRTVLGGPPGPQGPGVTRRVSVTHGEWTLVGPASGRHPVGPSGQASRGVEVTGDPGQERRPPAAALLGSAQSRPPHPTWQEGPRSSCRRPGRPWGTRREETCSAPGTAGFFPRGR